VEGKVGDQIEERRRGLAAHREGQTVATSRRKRAEERKGGVPVTRNGPRWSLEERGCSWGGRCRVGAKRGERGP
jgi:hypothetical protein